MAAPGLPLRALLEALVTEGPADHFAIELLGRPVSPWSDTFPESRTVDYLALARAELDSPTYDHAPWFFERGSDLPSWTGYTLGYRLVSGRGSAGRFLGV